MIRYTKEVGASPVWSAQQADGVVVQTREILAKLFGAGFSECSVFMANATEALYIAEPLRIKLLKEGGTGSDSPNPLQAEALPDRFEAETLNGPGIAGLAAAGQYYSKKGHQPRIRTRTCTR